MPLPLWLRKPVLPLPAAYDPLPRLVPRIPTPLDFSPVPVPHETAVLNAFRRLGFDTLQYARNELDSVAFANELLRILLDVAVMSVVIYAVFQRTAHAAPQVRRAAALVLSGLVLLWPVLVGRGEVTVFNFMRPAVGFRSSLLVWDLFQIRTVQEVQSWSCTRFVAHLWFFPMEQERIEERERQDGFKRNPRMQSLRNFPLGLVQGAASLVLLLFVPPKAVYDEMHWFNYRCYCFLLGITIFLLLSSGGLLMFNTFGLITGIEQEAMFHNPWFTTRLRHFWSRWNRAIATVLHRVIFGGEKTFKTLEERKAAEKRAAQGASDTAQGTSSAVASAGGAQRRTRASSSPSSSSSSSSSDGERDGEASGAYRKFWTKSGLAMLTFLISGLFHEYLISFASPHYFGYNTLFFLLNGLGTVLSSGVERFYPAVHQRIPGWARYLLMLAFYLCASPLFFAPLIAGDFFAHLQEVALMMLPHDRPPARPMFVFLFGK